MTIVRNTFESGLAAGTSLTTANTANPDAFTAVSGFPTYATSPVMRGTRSMAVAAAASTALYVEWSGITPSSNTLGWAARFYFYLPTQTMGNTDVPLAYVRSQGNGTGVATLLLRANNANALALSTDAGTTAASTQTAGTIAFDTWYRMEWVGTNPTTTTGTMNLRVYTGDSTTPISNLNIDAVNLAISASAVGTIRIGRASALGAALTYYFDDVAFASNQSSYIGPGGTNSLPSVNAGADVTTALNTSTTLTGTDSDADGTVTTRVWAFTSLPPGASAPTLGGSTTSTASFTPTVAGRYILSYTVTDDQGGVASDTVKVFVPALTASVIEVTSNPGGWTNVGGAADIPAAVRDSSDATYAQSLASTGTGALLRLRLAPMTAPATFTLNLRHLLSAAGSGAGTVTLYEGSTIRKIWTATPGTTIANQAFTLTSGEIATITSWNELDVELNWT